LNVKPHNYCGEKRVGARSEYMGLKKNRNHQNDLRLPKDDAAILRAMKIPAAAEARTSQPE